MLPNKRFKVLWSLFEIYDSMTVQSSVFPSMISQKNKHSCFLLDSSGSFNRPTGLGSQFKRIVCDSSFASGEWWCDDDDFNENLHGMWLSNLNSDKHPWIESSAGNPHIADFIAFVLDTPSSSRIVIGLHVMRSSREFCFLYVCHLFKKLINIAT